MPDTIFEGAAGGLDSGKSLRLSGQGVTLTVFHTLAVDGTDWYFAPIGDAEGRIVGQGVFLSDRRDPEELRLRFRIYPEHRHLGYARETMAILTDALRRGAFLPEQRVQRLTWINSERTEGSEGLEGLKRLGFFLRPGGSFELPVGPVPKARPTLPRQFLAAA